MEKSSEYLLTIGRNQPPSVPHMAWRTSELFSFSIERSIKVVHKMSKKSHIKGIPMSSKLKNQALRIQARECWSTVPYLIVLKNNVMMHSVITISFSTLPSGNNKSNSNNNNSNTNNISYTKVNQKGSRSLAKQ